MPRDIRWFIEPLNDYTTLKLRDAISTEHEHNAVDTSVGKKPLLFSTDEKGIYKVVNRHLRRDSDAEYALYRQVSGDRVVWQSEKTTSLRTA